MAVYYKAHRPRVAFSPLMIQDNIKYITVPLTSFAKDQTSTGTATPGESDDCIRTHGAEVKYAKVG